MIYFLLKTIDLVLPRHSVHPQGGELIEPQLLEGFFGKERVTFFKGGGLFS